MQLDLSHRWQTFGTYAPPPPPDKLVKLLQNLAHLIITSAHTFLTTSFITNGFRSRFVQGCFFFTTDAGKNNQSLIIIFYHFHFNHA